MFSIYLFLFNEKERKKRMINIFERSEIKYLLNINQYNQLLYELNQFLIKDKFYDYKICNIYYDTENYELFRLSIDKPIFKEKLRLRSYGQPNYDDLVFLEIKKKYDGTVYKRRIDLSLKEAYHFIENEEDVFDNSINAKEIKYILKRYKLLPKVYLSYDRKAYHWKDNVNFRITFDTNIKYRLKDVNLESGDNGEALLNDNQIIMELKCENGLPLEFVKTLSKLNLYPTSFSKIGTVYKNKILKNT
jgi:SPX domain protein involved in polyphosphate accumulation